MMASECLHQDFKSSCLFLVIVAVVIAFLFKCCLQFQYLSKLVLEDASSNIHWDSGRVEARNSSVVIYKGPELTSFETYTCRCRVWDERNTVGAWSLPLSFQVVDEYQPSWITAPNDGQLSCPSSEIR